MGVSESSTFLTKTLALTSSYFGLIIGIKVIGFFNIFSWLHSSKAFFAKNVIKHVQTSNILTRLLIFKVDKSKFFMLLEMVVVGVVDVDDVVSREEREEEVRRHGSVEIADLQSSGLHWVVRYL